MHIPDGFLDTKTAAATAALAAAGLGVALRHARVHLPQNKIPLLGIGAAFVFAAQMLNFPVAGGTSGHLVGGTLIAALLGPAAAVIVISCVLIVQCFLFADGGITALGANILNMALIGGVASWAIYFVVSRMIPGVSGRIVAATFAAWCATVLSAVACAGELAASKTVGWNIALTAMAGVHMLIGIGEGIITALILSAVATSRPELLAEPSGGFASRSYGSLAAFAVVLAIGLVLFVAPFASTMPDGLEIVAQRLGFEDKATSLVPAPMPDYRFGRYGAPIVGALGALGALGLGLVMARCLKPKVSAHEPPR